jgi:carboxyl-terminal processing protease
MVLATVVSAISMASPAALQNGRPIDFAATWRRVEGAIGSRYYDRQRRKDEMERLFAKYGKIASLAKSKSEFSEAVNAMIREFGDSHFDLLTDEDQGFYALGSFVRSDLPDLPHIGAWFKKSGDGYTVQMVLEGTPAQAADLRKGDLVMTIDGKPFRPVLPFKNRAGQKASLKIRRGGAVFDKSVDIRAAKGMNIFLEATRNSARIIEHGGRRFGYIHLWTMANDDFRDALSNAVYGKLKDTDAFILDIRDGFGGRPEGFGDPFFRPEANLEWKVGAASVQKQLFGYGRPLVVLINEGSRSAKEVFSYVMKKSKRGTLVGTNTAGHVLGTSPIPIDDWLILEIPMVELIAAGTRLEGVGVSPDIEVKPEFDESGADRVLQKGLEVALQKVAAAMNAPQLRRPLLEAAGLAP